MAQYRMQTVLEMRERAEEDAKQAFSEAMQALTKEKQEQKRLEEDLERRKVERKQRVDEYFTAVLAKKATGVSGMNLMFRFEGRLKDEEAQVALDIEKQKIAVKSAEKKVEQRRVEMAEAAKELKAIEKHKEKWAKEVKAERDMREELSQEEIGSALYLARSRKS